MDARWLRYSLYGAGIGFILGFVAGFLRARRGHAEVDRRNDQVISKLNELLQRARGGVTDDKTDN